MIFTTHNRVFVPVLDNPLHSFSLPASSEHHVRSTTPANSNTNSLDISNLIPWTTSQTISKNEDPQYTLIQLESHHQAHRSKNVLSLSRPKPQFYYTEELHARMNLMHLHQVHQPKGFVSKKPPSAKPSSKHQVTNNVTVFRPAPVNIPRHLHHDSLPCKRNSGSLYRNKRPKKLPRTDENATLSCDDNLPTVESYIESVDSPPVTDVEYTSDERYDDDDLTENEGLLLHHGFGPDLSGVAIRRSQFDQNQVTRGQPLNSIKVVSWTNNLTRFDYLLQNKKMDWRCEDDLYELLRTIDANKDKVTIEMLKTTQVGKMVRDLSKCEGFEERSRSLAKRIYKFWRKMCNDSVE